MPQHASPSATLGSHLVSYPTNRLVTEMKLYDVNKHTLALLEIRLFACIHSSSLYECKVDIASPSSPICNNFAFRFSLLMAYYINF